ncbi:MAG TPA: hypothetical protein DIV79_01710 [Opitutae bacterium]|nr:hypothetical protein [Opitutae bacterium]
MLDIQQITYQLRSSKVSSSFLWVVLSMAGLHGEESIEFNRDIRPLLSDNCYLCHGPDSEERKADLRLDVPSEAHKSAIVPGSADRSEAIARILSLDPEEQMPPPDSGKSLSDDEVDLLRRWIDEGAVYQKHWSFEPPKSREAPETSNPNWSRNPIDTFVLAKLEAKGIEPSPPADKTTLIRRATLDLTGVPPTIEEVDAFLADDSPEAYETLIDRLMESERFGERMAVDWLDAARYADTMGYQADWERTQWPWRTWVIDAYNRNLPFDEFTIEQLAGDLLPNPSVDQKIATGFNRNHRINDEGGIIPEEYLVEYLVDRVETTTGVWMGLTFGCARCHDHKYDPISQRDFYQFLAFFNSVPEKGKDGRIGHANPAMRVAMRGKQEEYERLKQSVADLGNEYDQSIDLVAPAFEDWSKETRERWKEGKIHWSIDTPSRVSISLLTKFDTLDDQSVLIHSDGLESPTYTVDLQPQLETVSALRLEVMPDASLKGGLTRGNGEILLSSLSIGVQRKGERRPSALKISSAQASFELVDYPVSNAFDKDKESGWKLNAEETPGGAFAVFALEEPIDIGPGDKLVVKLIQKSDQPDQAIGRFRLSTTSRDEPHFQAGSGIEAKAFAALRQLPEKRSPKEFESLQRHHATIAPENADIRERYQGAKGRINRFEVDYTTHVMVMEEMPEPRPTHILERGLYNNPVEQVEARVPEELFGPLQQDAPVNRLGLAKWLVSGQHPLTARVIVNRYWAMFFGNGLVETVEDFGLQGAYPSHPELLDWLAMEYPRLGWDTKALIKLIMTSATYRQSSEVSPELAERDPKNRLLARMTRFRLPAEMIRDQALFTSGLLVERIGGPSVKPYQPEGLWAELSFQSAIRTTDFYVQGSGEDLYRRSLYTFWKRSVPPPTMATFDAPSREMCVLGRPRTNTPLQALALMNDPTFVEAARVFAEEIADSSRKDPESHLNQAFRTILSRSPSESELMILKNGFEERLRNFRQDPDGANALLEVGESGPRSGLDPVYVAALSTSIMNLYNLDEAIHHE